MSVVAGEVAAGAFSEFGRNIGTELYFPGTVHLLKFFGSGFVGIVRRAPCEQEQEWLCAFRMIGDVGVCVIGLGDRVVAIPRQFAGCVGAVFGVIVVMGAFADFPIIEAMAAFARDKGISTM